MSSTRNTPRHYVVLACLPVILAAATLVGLYLYQRGADERRDRWQEPARILDALGVGSDMRVAEWGSLDTYFLEHFARRVGPGGKVFAIQPESSVAETLEDAAVRGASVVETLPEGLDAALLPLLRSTGSDTDRISYALGECARKLESGARLGILGVSSNRVRGYVDLERAKRLAQKVGLTFESAHTIGERQYLLVMKRATRKDPT